MSESKEISAIMRKQINVSDVSMKGYNKRLWDIIYLYGTEYYSIIYLFVSFIKNKTEFG
jgi:hypothetical protein